MHTFRVSHLHAFARWLEDEDSGPDWLIKYLMEGEETEAMAKGTAFHKFLENAGPETNWDKAEVDGYTFHFTGEFELYLPAMREIRMTKEYAGILVSGKADAPIGNTIYDHKTTESAFQAENYVHGYQHRFYMDMFGADRFIWNVWEMDKVKTTAPQMPFGLQGEMAQDYAWKEYEYALDEWQNSKHYNVRQLHKLEVFAYDSMHDECVELAEKFKAFADQYFPNGVPFERPSQAQRVREALEASLSE